MSSDNKPLISVLIPVYNCEKYIGECLESIINQDYPNMQVVIHDDGSTDKSLSICQDYSSRYDNVEVYSDDNQGVASARNHLLNKIKGDYFLFVDADDWIEPNTISTLIQIIRAEGSDMITCAVRRQENIKAKSIETWGADKFIPKFLFHKELSGSLCNKLVKTSLLHELRFREGLYYGEDALFTWKLLQNVQKITITNLPFYNYRSNTGSLSRQKWTADKKGSGYVVWREICEDVEKDYPEYLNVALSRCALEDMWALYFASQSRWPKDESIIMRQDFIKAHVKVLSEFRLDGNAAYYSALVLSKFYRLGILMSWINSLLRKIR